MYWILLSLALQTVAFGEVSPIDEAERIARLEIEATKANRAHLVVRVASSTVELRMRGVILESHTYDSVEIGAPLRTPTSDAMLDPLFTCRVPERPQPKEIVPGMARMEEDTTPHEGPRPRVATLPCEPGLVLRLVARSEVGSLRDLAGRIRWRGEASSPRVRIELEDAALESLLAALPAECFVIFDRSLAVASPHPS